MTHEKNLQHQNSKAILSKNANTPKDNFYFKDNPFNWIFGEQPIENQTIDSPSKINENEFSSKIAYTKMPLINGWTKASKPKLSKSDKENSLKPVSKYSHYILENRDKNSISGKSTSLISHFKNNGKFAKRGHKSSKSAYDGTKPVDTKIDMNKFKGFEEDFTINKKKILDKNLNSSQRIVKNYSKIKFVNLGDKSKDFLRTNKVVFNSENSFKNIKPNMLNKRKKFQLEEMSQRSNF